MTCPANCPRCGGLTVSVFENEVRYNERCGFYPECTKCFWRGEYFIADYKLRKESKQTKLYYNHNNGRVETRLPKMELLA